MTLVVFAGPSLAAADKERLRGVAVLPPAAQGDVYGALRGNPRAIGIIDGYFEGVPSVWHKEILWAMSRGVAVYGAASIGALRAAELHHYGMIGVGEIFAAYRDGILDADDEVALLHGPPETSFIPLTEPLVNVRATCRAAGMAGVISDAEAKAVVAAARAVFYKVRTWREILARVREAGAIPEHRLGNFESWLPEGAVDQKRLDALTLIERMCSDVSALAVDQQTVDFEPTFLWERAVAGWARLPARTGNAPDDPDASVLDELRLDPARYRAVKMRARLRLNALLDPTAAAGDRTAVHKRHRGTHNLYRAADLDRWLRAQHLDREEYDRLIYETAVAEAAGEAESPELQAQMIALLKLDGAFGAAAERVKAKAAALAASGETVLQPLMLVDWFFRERLGQDAPGDIDAIVRELGVASRAALYGLLAREYLYLAASEEERP